MGGVGGGGMGGVGGGGGVGSASAQEHLLRVLRDAHSEAALDTERTLLAIEKASDKAAAERAAAERAAAAAPAAAAAAAAGGGGKGGQAALGAADSRPGEGRAGPSPSGGGGCPLARHRLLLLAFLGRHTEALDLLATSVNDVHLAYSYCADHAAILPPDDHRAGTERAGFGGGGSVGGGSPSLFLQLLERYLRPPAGASKGAATGAATGTGKEPMVHHAAALLRLWPEGVSAVEALRRLPADLPLADLEGGLVSLLRDHRARLRHSQVRAALLRANSLQTRAELHSKRSRKLVVGSETECAVCGRRIGNAAFAWVPSGSFAHIGCHAGTASTNPFD